MTGLNLAIIWLNLAFASLAAVINLWVARSMPPGFGFVRAFIGVLAAAYAAGYVALLAGWVDLVSWSNFFRGVSPFAWLLAWILPAIYEHRILAVVFAHTDAQK